MNHAQVWRGAFTRSVGCTVLFAALLVTGCGPANSRSSVSGAVKFDGKDIAAGIIRFVTDDKKGINTNGPIIDGKYELTGDSGPTPGKYKVQISWLKKTGRKINTTENQDPEYAQDEAIEQIPAKYSVATTLVVEIKPGKNTHDFDLKR